MRCTNNLTVIFLLQCWYKLFLLAVAIGCFPISSVRQMLDTPTKSILFEPLSGVGVGAGGATSDMPMSTDGSGMSTTRPKTGSPVLGPLSEALSSFK